MIDGAEVKKNDREREEERNEKERMVTEINELEMSGIRNEDILRLQITMNDANGVKVTNSENDLSDVLTSHWFLKVREIFEKGGYVSADEIFHDEVEIFLSIREGVERGREMWRMKRRRGRKKERTSD